MDRKFSRIGALLILMLVGVLVVTPGCGKKPKPAGDVTQQTVPPDDGSTTTPGTEAEGDRPGESEEATLRDVFFDYDSYNLREDARRLLETNARYLLDNPGSQIVLEGHCDERGTVEYNLALGERRAQSVRDYLIEFGINSGRLSTVSYGEERPFSQGHSEQSWSQNRRVHFVGQ